MFSHFTSNLFRLQSFKEILLSKVECEDRNEILEKCEVLTVPEHSYLAYETESLVATLLENEILLVEQISLTLDSFFDDQTFNVYSIIDRLDTTYHNYIDEIE